MIRVADYPQMKACAWYLAPDAQFNDREALNFYERNWKYIEQNKLTVDEKQLIRRLANEVGNGFLNV
ncbi:hypothetical protein SOV92_22930 [Pectobacterium brasiliense]|uniref:Uncharacterized protein n=1 Tax=Pectobacterium brasiliense TaxID=180957 RepID=A0AAE2WD36_9GAMM|nr:hypothetical protein [Pectobacterium brasiliense]MBN3050462.1 hypothetical protein [Pectobacterium brasiliense]MBN3117029.1 hypothetical protein [Pectobacterium brasiliense]MDY4380621.1 hypothetical protein [Pectobacterium brasiliense]WJM82158.1 hypothetical protein QTI90_05260 [Pectobacterium brasiliense]